VEVKPHLLAIFTINIGLNLEKLDKDISLPSKLLTEN
jgi:hypothetical protein